MVNFHSLLRNKHTCSFFTTWFSSVGNSWAFTCLTSLDNITAGPKSAGARLIMLRRNLLWIGPLHDLVLWYGMNHVVTQWDFQKRGTHTSPARLSFVMKVPQCTVTSIPAKCFPYHVTGLWKEPTGKFFRRFFVIVNFASTSWLRNCRYTGLWYYWLAMAL